MLTSPQSWSSTQYPWSKVEGVQIAPMVIYRGRVPSRWGAHTHPFYTWWWVESGSVRLEVPGEVLEAAAGQWIFIPPGIRRIQTFSPETHLISMNFFAHWPDNLPLLFLPRPLVEDGAAHAGLRELAARVCAVLGHERNSEYLLSRMKLTLPEVLAVKAGLHEFVGALFGYVASRSGEVADVSPEDPRLVKVLNWMQANLRAGPLPFSQWREQTGLGRSQLENLARKHLRMSLTAYRNRMLSAEACRRLALDSALVKQVGDALGFVDSSHFCRWLRQHTGRSPGDFRHHPL